MDGLLREMCVDRAFLRGRYLNLRELPDHGYWRPLRFDVLRSSHSGQWQPRSVAQRKMSSRMDFVELGTRLIAF